MGGKNKRRSDSSRHDSNDDYGEGDASSSPNLKQKKRSRHVKGGKYSNTKANRAMMSRVELTSTPHSYVTSRWTRYQTAHRSSLRSEVVLDVVRDATPVEEMPSNTDLSPEQKTQLLEERKLVRELVGLARQQRSQNARTKYARPTGVAPCTPVKLSVEGEGGAEGLTGNRYISFKDSRRVEGERFGAT